MASLTNALQQLRAEHRRAQLEVEKLGQAISVIESLNGSGTSRNGNQPKRTNIGSFTPENGGRTEGEVGGGSQGT
jgi:hypothetical protein